MPEWRDLVRQHLHLPGLERRRSERIVDEIAAQLEEIHDAALARGATAAEAEDEAARHVADWELFASEMATAERPNREPVLKRWLDRGEEVARGRGALGRVAADLVHDIRYALRGLRQAPGFTATVVAVLGLGIGAATAMFAVVDSILLEPLPFPAPERLITIWTLYTNEAPSWTPLSGPNFLDIEERSSSFDELGLQTLRWVNLSGDGRPERIRACQCTSGFLGALGVAPALGRVFSRREVEGKERLVVLSDHLWRNRFGGADDLVGRDIRINGDAYRVVGVMPEGFFSPQPWPTSNGAEMWLPVTASPAGDLEARDHNWLFGLGRLRPGVSPEAAEAELQAIGAALESEHPDVNADKAFWTMPLSERMVYRVEGPLLFLGVGAALLLLIAAVNAASIITARASARQPLAAIRASLGASRGRLVRQAVTETLVLSAVGGAAGLLVSWWGTGVLRRSIPATVQRSQSVTLDLGVLILALAATIAVGLLIGLSVGLTRTRRGVAGLARSSLRSHSRSRRRSRLDGATVVIQFALTLLLAYGAALMLRSYVNAVTTPLAFDTGDTLTAGITLEGETYQDEAVARAFWDALVKRVGALPGVEGVGLTSKLPLNGGSNGSVLVEDEVFEAGAQRPTVEYSYSTAGYFGAMGIAVVEGRTFVPEDGDSGKVGLIVNRAFAERYYPGESAIGKTVRQDSKEPDWVGHIVGVVEDVPQWGMEWPVLREIYFPFSFRTITEPSLVVAAGPSPERLVPEIRRLLTELDPSVPLAEVRRMDEVVAADVHSRRMTTIAIALFAGVGFILVGTGIYGVIASQVVRRRHEIGIRMAIGADRSSVLRLVIGNGLVIAGVGVIIGLTASVALSKGFENLLFGVAAVDPLSIAAVVLALAAVAVVGTAVPAVRAAATNPIETLQSE
jgi:predicted permease